MSDNVTSLLGRGRELLWARAHPVPTLDPQLWRVDDYGRTIRFSDFRNDGSIFGWTMGFSECAARDGQDAARALRPLSYAHLAARGSAIEREFVRAMRERCS